MSTPNSGHPAPPSFLAKVWQQLFVYLLKFGVVGLIGFVVDERCESNGRRATRRFTLYRDDVFCSDLFFDDRLDHGVGRGKNDANAAGHLR